MNYSLVEYKVFWTSAVDMERKCYLRTGKSSVTVSCCSDKFFSSLFFQNGSKVLLMQLHIINTVILTVQKAT